MMFHQSPWRAVQVGRRALFTGGCGARTMKTHVRAVVIGGGVVGVSTIYHLARKGWGEDAVLLEQAELTSGSTWHAAGLLPLFNMSYSVGQIHKYSVELYRGLEAETGQAVGFRQVGNLRLAMNRDRMDEFTQYAATARTIGVNVEFLTPAEIGRIWPLCNTEGLVGALFHPEDGYIQPADLTQALAAGARARGATIYRNTRVTGIDRTAGGEWLVKTDRGDIACEHVVSRHRQSCPPHRRHGRARCAGHAGGTPVHCHGRPPGTRRTGLSRESRRWRCCGSPMDPGTCGEENRGFILGPYEKGAPCCYVDDPPVDAEYELFQEDIDRLEPHIEAAINRVPAFGECGVKQVYNGAIAYTPDGNPIVGPAWGIRNFWLNEGHSFGITAAGGAGWQLAEWIVEGEPTIDMLGVEPRRFGAYANRDYLLEKNEDAYAHVFVIHSSRRGAPRRPPAEDGALL